MNTYLYTANVNEGARAVEFVADPEKWEEAGEELTIESAELIIDNERDVYFSFYAGASDYDFDAERTDATLYVREDGDWIAVDAR